MKDLAGMPRGGRYRPVTAKSVTAKAVADPRSWDTLSSVDLGMDSQASG